MTVIDAQIHIWGAETPERPWPLGGAALVHRPTPLGKTEELDSLSDIDTTCIMGRGIAE
jgi:L-fuconolactonase